MHSILSRLRISHRVLLALIVPIIGLLALGTVQLVEKYRISSEMEEVVDLATLAPQVSALVHEMQEERGMSAGFIGSRGKSFADEIGGQRALTDEKRAIRLEAFANFDKAQLPESFSTGIADATDRVAKLDATRNSVDDYSFSVGDMASDYSSTVASLLSLVEGTAVLTSSAEVTREIMAYASFLQAKERAGIERAMGSGGFSAGQFAPQLYNKFVSLIAQQESYFSQFAIFATEEEVAFWKDHVTGPAVDEVERMRGIAIEGGLVGNLGGVTGPY